MSFPIIDEKYIKLEFRRVFENFIPEFFMNSFSKLKNKKIRIFFRN